MYGVDTTVDLRPDAETLPDRGKVYSTSQKKAMPGHQYSWLGRIVSQTPPAPEHQVEFPLPKGLGMVRVSDWGQLHFKEVARLVGTVVRVEFFTPDGQPKYRRPLWLILSLVERWAGRE